MATSSPSATQGIAGAKLGDIDGLALTAARPTLLARTSSSSALDDADEDEDGEGSGDAAAASPEIERALYELVPADGRPTGNLTLRSELELRHEVSEAQFQAARQLLIAKGWLRKGRGRGGAVMRTGRQDAAPSDPVEVEVLPARPATTGGP